MDPLFVCFSVFLTLDVLGDLADAVGVGVPAFRAPLTQRREAAKCSAQQASYSHEDTPTSCPGCTVCLDELTSPCPPHSVVSDLRSALAALPSLLCRRLRVSFLFVLVDSKGEVKLSDFGISRSLEGELVRRKKTLRRTPVSLGSPYLAGVFFREKKRHAVVAWLDGSIAVGSLSVKCTPQRDGNLFPSLQLL